MDHDRSRPRLLLIWDSRHKPGMELFRSYQSTFDISHLLDDLDIESDYGFSNRRYRDFKSPVQLLNELSIDLIVFKSIDSFLDIALNVAALRMGIKTYVLHHGIYQSNVLELESIKAKHIPSVTGYASSGGQRHTYGFYARAALKNLLALPAMIRYAIYRRSHGINTSKSKTHSKWLLPTKFIQLSPKNAEFEKSIYKLNTDDKFIYTGHPFYDEFCQKAKSRNTERIINEPYYLLIDFPNLSSNIAFQSLGIEKKMLIYDELAKIAARAGNRLVVKTHPADPGEKSNNENIRFIDDCEIVHLIQQAEHCFAFYSSLLAPIVWMKGNCTVITLDLEFSMSRDMAREAIVETVHYEELAHYEIVNKEGLSGQEHADFTRRYLWKMDGEASQRVLNELKNSVV